MKQTVLFLCPHHAAKSVIAAAYFNRLAQEYQLPFAADSAGTEPDAAISPIVVALLREEGIDVSGQQPHRVTEAELASATHIISMGCTPQELGVDPERITLWSSIPPVSEDPQLARAAIYLYVKALANTLREGS
jgi:arsenate reductase (thioredoxin)